MKDQTSDSPPKGIEFTPQFEKTLKLLEIRTGLFLLLAGLEQGKARYLIISGKQPKRSWWCWLQPAWPLLMFTGRLFTPFFLSARISPRKSEEAAGFKAKLIKSLDAIIIDEISMVRADLLDCVDLALRLNRDSENLPLAVCR